MNKIDNRQTRRYALIAILGFISLIYGCSQDTGGTKNGESSEEDTIQYQLAGSVALGRAGSWAEVCAEDDCTRADQDGNYRFSPDVNESRLLTASIPNTNGSLTAITGFYRHDPDQTSALVNINPTTEAILDAWSRFELDRTLQQCLTRDACRNALTRDFSSSVQQASTRQLDEWLGSAWRTERDPFHDLYVADPMLDWLDQLHDHVFFVPDDTGLSATDRDGFEIARISYRQLFDPVDPAPPIDEALLEEAFNQAVPDPDDSNPIDISLHYSPGQPMTAPVEITVNASNSGSRAGGTLGIHHELIVPGGLRRSYAGGLVTTILDNGGPHLWVVTVSDDYGNRRTTGVELDVRSMDTAFDPTFGAQGSCRTTAMTANSQNICEETVDGGLLGQCQPTSSGQTLTQLSPGACSPIEQNGGVLLGLCTSVINEIRVYHYDNPLRNSGETLAEQREREAQRCTSTLGGTWSRLPD